MKKCGRCKTDKLESEFYNENRCQKCKDYYDAYYKNNRQQEIDRAKSVLNKDRNKTNAYKRSLCRQNPIGYMIQRIKSRAKLGNIPFDLSKEDIVIPDICPVLGIALKVNSGKVGPDSISLDRLIPELGYVKGNVMVISHKANTIKNNATLEELEKLVDWLKELSNDRNSRVSRRSDEG